MYFAMYLIRVVLIMIAVFSMQKPLLRAEHSLKLRFAWWVMFLLAFTTLLEGIHMSRYLW